MLFSIGDVAELFHISVGTLRHYENAGLVKPEYINEKTGYRYYSVRQFDTLNTIRYLRLLDMPLKEIGDFLQNREIDVMEEKLLLQKETVIQKQKELKQIERKIDNRLRLLKDARTRKLNEISLQKLPACRMVLSEGSLKIRNFFDMEMPIRKLEAARTETAVFLGKVGIGISEENMRQGKFDQYDCIFLLLDEEDSSQGNVRELPETLCVTVRFCGSHGEAAEQYRKLFQYMEEEKLTVSGFSREITLIDYVLTSDTSKFVTEISIPVIQNK